MEVDSAIFGEAVLSASVLIVMQVRCAPRPPHIVSTAWKEGGRCRWNSCFWGQYRV